MIVQVARERRTGYPVVRHSRADKWVGLLPVTKLQVEQWLADGGMLRTDAGQVSDLTGRLEMSGDMREYPETVQSLRRIPPAKCTRENVLSIVATHLSIWTDNDDIRRPDLAFPTRESEWGSIASWLHGMTPSSKEWKATLDAYARAKTKELLQGVLAQSIAWDSIIQTLMHKLLSLFGDDDLGLPFMNLGLYELTRDTKKFDRLTVDLPETVFRPIVAGDSKIWPTLDGESSHAWRPVLQKLIPVVGARLWFSDNHVKDSAENGEPRGFEVTACQPGRQIASATRISGSGQRASALGSYYRGRITMRDRCPVCYKPIDKNVFRSWPTIWCYAENVAEQGGSGGVSKTVYGHSTAPKTTGAILSQQPISLEYLTVARNSPAAIRSVTLSGVARAGKGMFLLSLVGLMHLPLGGARFLKAFPDTFNFSRTNCSLAHPVTTSEHENVLRQVEDLWVDGIVPTRTSKTREALRCPILFECRREGLFGTKSKKQLILILNDIAGEIVKDAKELAANEKFPHVASTSDVLFLVPADTIQHGADDLDRFASCLGAVVFEGQALSTKRINLILAVSQIDKLKHRGDGKLLEIFLRRPCALPFEPQESELQGYLKGMDQIHYDLEFWFRQNVPNLVQVARRFASVRYCGFSSVGSELINLSMKPGSDSCLPFAPQPFRVADPLFWLFRENGLLDM